MSEVLRLRPSVVSAHRIPTRPSGGVRRLDLRISRWRWIYSRCLALTDLVALSVATGLAAAVRFGLDSAAETDGDVMLTYRALGGCIVLVWWFSLALARSRHQRIVGTGYEEYARLTRATFAVFGCLAIFSLMFRTDLSRGYLAMALPLGWLLLIANRKAWRVWLRRCRGRGECMGRVLVVGGTRSAASLTRLFDRNATVSGLQVTGVWMPDQAASAGAELAGPAGTIPVFGSAHTLAGALTTARADAVVVTDTEHLGADGLRELTWELQGVDVDLMVAPNVVDVAGSRIHMRAVAGMPLLHLEEPQFAGAGLWPKVVFDKLATLAILALIWPVMAVTAVLIKLSSPGPVLFRQTRVGLNGSTFEMIKFRSMAPGSQALQAELLAQQGTADRPLFKIANDPRITPVGAVLRRFSIDELPQLLNVLRGDMSLVGPRPQQAAEVDLYDRVAYRRLTVRPGMTGLWQVSGRSKLSWEDAIRLDTSYVENWSLTADLAILVRTVRAVVGSHGAV